MVTDHPPGVHCRICGSLRIDRFNYSIDISNKVDWFNILQRDGSLDQLIRPCECRGQFAYAHSTCLSKWIETTRHEHCDICRFKYNVRYIERSLFDWVFETEQLKSILKIVGYTLLIYYISALGILLCRARMVKDALDIAVLCSAWLWIIGCSIGSIYCICKYIQNFKSWKLLNRKVIIQENKSPKLDEQIKPKDILKSSGFKPK